MKKSMFTDFKSQTRTAQDTINEFINSKKGRKAESTIRYYEIQLNCFSEYLTDIEKITDLSEVTRAVIDRYMNGKKERNPDISNQTLNNYLRAIRTFINYCINEGYIQYFKVVMFPATNIPKKPYTAEEQAKLLKKPDLSKCSFVEYRNWVIVCHFLASGNRSRTVRYIKIGDVDLSKRKITLDTTKNGEMLIMPISDTYYPILRDYLTHRKGTPDDYLFCNFYGQQLSEYGLRNVMRQYHKSRGVETTSLHRFRNTFAETWIMNDGSPKKLQYALGHKSSRMVDEYVSVYGKELTEEFNDFAPLSLQKGIFENKRKMPNPAKN